MITYVLYGMHRGTESKTTLAVVRSQSLAQLSSLLGTSLASTREGVEAIIPTRKMATLILRARGIAAEDGEGRQVDQELASLSRFSDLLLVQTVCVE